MKRILVTGGAGFLGSHLCKKLLDEENEVICVDNFYTGCKTNILPLLSNPYFEVIRHDITFPLYLEVDEIYNLACPASPIHYQKDPSQTTKTCVHGAINMLGLAKRTNARILQASTSEVYGDPALLYPRYYNPTIEKTYKWGIIPHYVDQKHPWLNRFRNMKNVKIINILDPINKVVDEIKSCEMIISSSLHGVIAGDAYGVPSKWIILSDKVKGDGFKFRDYFASVKRTDIDPILCTPNIRLIDIEKQFVDYKIDIDLDLLYDACPFKQS